MINFLESYEPPSVKNLWGFFVREITSLAPAKPTKRNTAL
jgi:hypothetical protein